MGITAAAALVGAGAVVKTAISVTKVVRAARAFHVGVEGAQDTIKASRLTAAIAGRIMVGRNPVKDVARNGTRWLRSSKGFGTPAEIGYRSAARKTYKKVSTWSSTITVGNEGGGKGGKSTYRAFHVTHSSRWL